MTSWLLSPPTMGRGGSRRSGAPAGKQHGLGQGLVAVNEQTGRRNAHDAHGVAHGLKSGLQDIDVLNASGPDHAQTPGHGAGFDARGQKFARFCAHGFGIREAGQVVNSGKNDGGGHHRPGQTAAPGFVNTCNGAGNLSGRPPGREVIHIKQAGLYGVFLHACLASGGGPAVRKNHSFSR